MANRTKVTQLKRARERAKRERQQEKTRRRGEAREEAKIRRANAPRSESGEDPDIAGIVPGPQPSPWGDDFTQSGEDEEEKA
jgi:hypothetical protein